MKRIKKRFFYFFNFLTFCLIIGKVGAQPISCADFTITGFSPNPLDTSEYLITVQFSGAENQIINYPHFSLVFDGDGDTAAFGNIFFFGQLGGTSQDYPVTPIGGDIQPPFTALFIFGTDNGEDSCYLSFPPFAGMAEEEPGGSFSLFPNPASDLVFIRTEHDLAGTPFFLYDVAGVQLMQGTLLPGQTPLEISRWPAGVYFLSAQKDRFRTIKLIKTD